MKQETPEINNEKNFEKSINLRKKEASKAGILLLGIIIITILLCIILYMMKIDFMFIMYVFAGGIFVFIVVF